MSFETLAGHTDFIRIAVSTIHADGTVSILIRILVVYPVNALTVDTLLRHSTHRRHLVTGEADDTFNLGIQAGSAIIGEIASTAISGYSTGKKVFGASAGAGAFFSCAAI